jgi:hypothetical protein
VNALPVGWIALDVNVDPSVSVETVAYLPRLGMIIAIAMMCHNITFLSFVKTRFTKRVDLDIGLARSPHSSHIDFDVLCISHELAQRPFSKSPTVSVWTDSATYSPLVVSAPLKEPIQKALRELVPHSNVTVNLGFVDVSTECRRRQALGRSCVVSFEPHPRPSILYIELLSRCLLLRAAFFAVGRVSWTDNLA